MKPPGKEIRCAACGREWPDVIETAPGITYCECGALLVKVVEVTFEDLRAMYGSSPDVPPALVWTPRA